MTIAGPAGLCPRFSRTQPTIKSTKYHYGKCGSADEVDEPSMLNSHESPEDVQNDEEGKPESFTSSRLD